MALLKKTLIDVSALIGLVLAHHWLMTLDLHTTQWKLLITITITTPGLQKSSDQNNSVQLKDFRLSTRCSDQLNKRNLRVTYTLSFYSKAY